jgi:adenine-specific DNA-methyltransferase
MEKLKMHTPIFTDDKVEKLAVLFSDCITEARDEKGTLTKQIDFDQLRQELSDHIVEGPRERYHLDWPGKRESLLAANAPIAKTLRPYREESVDFDTTKNLFIEGDNLDALKLLQETYLGKVKVIYIDPPYNTGNDFIYNDDFADSIEDYKIRSNQLDEKGNRLTANPNSNGRFHSDWLSMMYSRLRLARNLLEDAGAIFISVDDHESHNMRKICEEVFGEENFVADIVWQKRYTRSNNTIDFTTVVEHILLYRRSIDFSVNLLPRTDDADARYTNPDQDQRGPWKGASFLNPATPQERPNLCYPIQNPNTKEVTLPSTNAWRRSREEFERLLAENKLYWGLDGKSPIPSIKMFLSEARGLTPINFWSHEYAGNTDQGTQELEEMMGSKLFNNPKPVQLMKRILEHATGPNDIVLDFFAGSGTTAQAVLQLNAETGGTRRFIMVQLPEMTDMKSEAYRAGYSTIAEITKERIRRAGKKVVSDNALTSSSLDVGFRVLKIDTSNMRDVYYAPEAIKQDDLVAHADNIKENRSAEDLLFQVLVDWGVDPSLPVSKEEVMGKVIFTVDSDALTACFASDINEALCKQIASRKPLRVVFRDHGFPNDSSKINAEQIFKLLSPATEMRTI